MNVMDQMLQNTVPVVGVPVFEDLPVLDRPGHRFLLARDGLWLELRRPWLHLVWPLGQSPAVTIPYGSLTKKVTLTGSGRLPTTLMQQFCAEARDHARQEHAAWVIWDAELADFCYQRVGVKDASAGHIRYDCPALPDLSISVEF